ncbi:MAG TPA: hypothetical protein VGZ22_16785 [Isosphaeraceae bacterium]|jgi:hypothetical protein|nr:hypothetical protein [Isosphaeraceae bacterium]
MPIFATLKRASHSRIWFAIALVAALSALAVAQQPKAAPDATRVRMEYVHQEVQADAVVQTMNDLDGQGWNIFQVIPTWQIKNDNGQSELQPRAYEVFGRRPAK